MSTRAACCALVGALLSLSVAPAAAQPIVDPENPGWTGDPENPGWVADPENPGRVVDPENPGWISDPENPGWVADPENPGWVADPENPGRVVDPENPGWIADPENPGRVVDPENPGWIADPENPGTIADPENPGAIADPENPGGIVDPQNITTSVAASPPRPLVRPVVFRGAYGALVGVDLAREDAFEHTAEVEQSLSLRVRYGFHERWTLTLEGALRWWMSGPGDADRSPIVVDTDRWEGRVRPELRDATISGRAASWLLRFGNQSIVWGSTDVTRPSDVINPRDFTRGFSIVPGEARTPIPAFAATRVLDRGSWQFVYVPFFVPHRIDAFSGSVPLLSIAEPVVGGVPPALTALLIGAGPIDAATSEALTEVVLTTDAPDATLRNGSLGTRVAYSHQGWDLALGYFYGFDRTPHAVLSQDGLTLLGGLLAPDASPESVALIAQGLLDQFTGGDPLYSATYKRLHTLQHDGVRYAGPVGFRWELVAQPERTHYLETLEVVRRPTLSAALGIGYESGNATFLWSNEVFYQHAFLRDADAAALLDLDRLWALASVVNLGMGAFGDLGSTRWDDLSLQLTGLYLPGGHDLAVQTGATFLVNDSLRVSTDVTLVASAGEATTIGDLATGIDSWRVALTRSF